MGRVDWWRSGPHFHVFQENGWVLKVLNPQPSRASPREGFVPKALVRRGSGDWWDPYQSWLRTAHTWVRGWYSPETKKAVEKGANDAKTADSHSIVGSGHLEVVVAEIADRG